MLTYSHFVTYVLSIIIAFGIASLCVVWVGTSIEVAAKNQHDQQRQANGRQVALWGTFLPAMSVAIIANQLLHVPLTWLSIPIAFVSVGVLYALVKLIARLAMWSAKHGQLHQ